MHKFSIITVNLNNATGLKKTMDSVLHQSYSNFEYIVIDGGSIDQSVETIKSEARRLSHWITEKDKGVYDAMNKAIKVANGEYLLFLNSGDYLTDKNTLADAVGQFENTDIVYGNLQMVEEEKSYTAVYPSKLSFADFVEGSLPHPGSFIKRRLFDELGYYDETLRICADWKFFLEAICRHNASYKHIDQTIAFFYLNGLSSSPESKAIIQNEKEKVLNSQYPLFMELYYAYVRLKTKASKGYSGIWHRLKKVVGV